MVRQLGMGRLGSEDLENQWLQARCVTSTALAPGRAKQQRAGFSRVRPRLSRDDDDGRACESLLYGQWGRLEWSPRIWRILGIRRPVTRWYDPGFWIRQRSARNRCR